MRKLYLSFPKSETLSHQLTWSHYFEILKSNNDLELNFYAKQCELERWSVREYSLYLPDKAVLSKQLERLLEKQEEAISKGDNNESV